MSLFATLIYPAYCANLVSILLTPKIVPPFDSYHSLYYDTDYEIGYPSGSDVDEYFQVKTISYTTIVQCS